MAKLKIINVDSTIDNADWIKGGRPDIQKMTSPDDVLKFLGMAESSLDKLSENEIKEIASFSWYKSLPRHIRLSFSGALSKLAEKDKDSNMEKIQNAPF